MISYPLSEPAISVCYCKSCWSLWEVDGTVYWTAGTTGSMTLLWHCFARYLHLNDIDVVRLMNYLLINEWVVTHTIRPVRERGEREVRLLRYPRYCLVQTLHNISLTLVCWVIATSNHQTFEVTARVSWCLISLDSLTLLFSYVIC